MGFGTTTFETTIVGDKAVASTPVSEVDTTNDVPVKANRSFSKRNFWSWFDPNDEALDRKLLYSKICFQWGLRSSEELSLPACLPLSREVFRIGSLSFLCRNTRMCNFFCASFTILDAL